MKTLLIWLLFTVTQLNANNLETYHNNRFNFSIDYPADMLSKKEYPINGDGIWLSNKEGSVKLTPTGRLMIVNNSINEVYKESMAFYKERKDIELTYKQQKKNWFVLSGYNHKENTIFYEKRFTYLLDNTPTLVGYIFEYPIKDKNKYGKWIKVFNESFDYGENYLSVKEINEIKKSNQSYEVYQKLNKYDIFFMLVKSSRHIKSWSRHTDLKYFHPFDENADNEAIWSMIYIDKEARGFSENEAAGLGVMGHFNYNIKSKKLFNTLTGDKIEEEFEKVWTDIMDIYLFDKKREYLFLKKKTFLYKESNLKSKSKKFLIKNDCTLIVDKTDDGWYKVFYYHPNLHTNTIMWIKFDAKKHGVIK